MIRRLSAAAASLLALAATMPAAAQTPPAPDAWRASATLYGWAPAIGGSTSFPATGSGPSIDVNSRQVIDALKMAFMGSLELRRGKWGVATDLVYADFGADQSGSRDFTLDHGQLPVGVDAALGLDITSWIWSLGAVYSLADIPEGTSDLLLGTRLLDMEQTLRWSINGTVPGLPPAARSGTATVGINQWDAIVGVKGRINIGTERKWFLPYYLDVGTGQSRLTWQVMGGVGYQFGWGSVIAAWRYLDYDFKSDMAVRSLSLNGGVLGVQVGF
jgi:hypothetical protein